MTNRLANKTDAPPGGWRYPLLNGRLFRAQSWPDLLNGVAAQWPNRAERPLDLAEQIEVWLCKELPDYCTGSEPPRFNPLKELQVTAHSVTSGMKVLARHFFANGGVKVPAALAESRASVCASCPHNVAREDCNGCNLGALRDQVVRVIGSEKTSKDEELKVCRLCLCENRAKVWVGIKSIWPSLTAEEKAALPVHCWVKQEGEAPEQNSTQSS